jgi:hypothetical protein
MVVKPKTEKELLTLALFLRARGRTSRSRPTCA